MTKSVHEFSADMLEHLRQLNNVAATRAVSLHAEAGGALNQDLAIVWLAIDVICKTILVLHEEEESRG
jgi:hypothetical protein